MIKYNTYVFKSLLKGKFKKWFILYIFFFLINILNQSLSDSNVLYSIFGFLPLSDIFVSDILFKVIKYLIYIFFIYEFISYDLFNLCDEVLIRTGKIKWFLYKIAYIICIYILFELIIYLCIYFFIKSNLIFRLLLVNIVFFLNILFAIFMFIFSKINNSKFYLIIGIILILILSILYYFYNITNYLYFMLFLLFISFLCNITLVKKRNLFK